MGIAIGTKKKTGKVHEKCFRYNFEMFGGCLGGVKNEVYGSRKEVSCGTPKLMECRIKNVH